LYIAVTALVTVQGALFYVGGRNYETEQLHLQHTALKERFAATLILGFSPIAHIQLYNTPADVRISTTSLHKPLADMLTG
jgi:hypothetical protein